MHSLLTSAMITMGSLALAQVLAPAPQNAEDQASDLTLSVVSMAISLDGQRLMQGTHGAQLQTDDSLVKDIEAFKGTWRVVETADEKLQLYDAAGNVLGVIDTAANPPVMNDGPEGGAALEQVVYEPSANPNDPDDPRADALFLKLKFTHCGIPHETPTPPNVHQRRMPRPRCEHLNMNFVLWNQ